MGQVYLWWRQNTIPDGRSTKSTGRELRDVPPDNVKLRGGVKMNAGDYVEGNVAAGSFAAAR